MSDSHQLAVATIVSSMIGKDRHMFDGGDGSCIANGGIGVVFREGAVVLIDQEDNCITLETIVNHVSYLLNQIDEYDEDDDEEED